MAITHSLKRVVVVPKTNYLRLNPELDNSKKSSQIHGMFNYVLKSALAQIRHQEYSTYRQTLYQIMRYLFPLINQVGIDNFVLFKTVFFCFIPSWTGLEGLYFKATLESVIKSCFWFNRQLPLGIPNSKFIKKEKGKAKWASLFPGGDNLLKESPSTSDPHNKMIPL